jgi:histidine ammonia-lyase/phenylalanine ammonia-lyase
MGAISAREARRVLDLSETVAVIHLLALAQAMDLRGLERFGAPLLALHAAVRERVPMNREDRRMDHDIEHMLGALRADELPLPDVETSPEGGLR